MERFKRWKVLLLEDNELFAESIKDFLEDKDFDIDIVVDGEEAISQSYYNNYDIYLLDINVPFVNGVDFLRMIRRSGDERPTIFITSHQDKDTLIKGYESGCDDYMKKPIDLEELYYRIQVLLNRRRTLQSKVEFGKNCYYDFAKRALYKDNKSVSLSMKALKLLELLLEYKNEVVTKEQIIRRLWSSSDDHSEGSIRVYINKIKKAIGEDMIQNVKGIGYKLIMKNYNK